MKRDITDVTQDGHRLYDFYDDDDDDGHLVEFIHGSDVVKTWTHVPHQPPG